MKTTGGKIDNNRLIRSIENEIKKHEAEITDDTTTIDELESGLANSSNPGATKQVIAQLQAQIQDNENHIQQMKSLLAGLQSS